jgi:hypothetical protein
MVGRPFILIAVIFAGNILCSAQNVSKNNVPADSSRLLNEVVVTRYSEEQGQLRQMPVNVSVVQWRFRMG